MAHSGLKTVAIMDDPRIIRLEPGTTVGEAIRLAGFQGEVRIQSPAGGGLLEADEDLYSQVKDGEKLSASPGFIAGGMFTFLRRSPPPVPYLLPPGITTETDWYWTHRAGWREQDGTWRGYFRLGPYAPVRGKVEMATGYPRVSFMSPPRVIEEHRCVHPKAGELGWFDLHEHGVQSNRTLRGLIASVQVWLLQTLKQPLQGPLQATLQEPVQYRVGLWQNILGAP
jgi:hypothetical protein